MQDKQSNGLCKSFVITFSCYFYVLRLHKTQTCLFIQPILKTENKTDLDTQN